jgi:transposase
MAKRELEQAAVLERIAAKKCSQKAGAKQLGISSRQLRRIQKRYRAEGAAGLASKKRGKPSNHQVPPMERNRIIEIIATQYKDFGPTLAHEKLVEHHSVCVSVETIRQLMISNDLWITKKQVVKKIHQLRTRRNRFGELVQIDGSPHAWFEERGQKCTLIVFIDDATSRLVGLKFYPTETTQAYMEVAHEHLKNHGRPCSYYADRHSIFVTTEQAGSIHNQSELTQLGRALKTLDIELIHALTPQAKGRVERANKTLQDRLVKELRLKGISDISAANAYLPEFMKIYNAKFSKPPKEACDAHRPVLHTEQELELIFSRHTQRKVSKSLEIRYDNKVLQIDKHKHRMKGAQVTICESFNHTITLLHQGQEVAFKLFDGSEPYQHPQQDEKMLNDSVDRALSQQSTRPRYKPAIDHPWRKDRLAKAFIYPSSASV